MASFKKPIFVLSAPRSGSTLFRLILDSHPNLAVPPPAWLYELIRPYLYSYGDLSVAENFKELASDMLEAPTIKRWSLGVTAKEIIEKAEAPTYAALYEAIHIVYAEQSKKKRWGEKTPRNAFWVDEIKTDFDDAQFIHLIRDGRDMAIDISDSPQMQPHSLYAGAIVWKNCVSAICRSAKMLSAKQYYEVRYEDLCVNPEVTINKVCNFLGEDFDPKMLSHHESHSSKNWSADPQHAKTARPITTEYCEMYKNRLPKQDVAYLNNLFGDLLDHWKYPMSDGKKEIPEHLAAQLLQGDIVTSPDNNAYKYWHAERRKDRLSRGVFKAENRDSLLWSVN